MPGIEISLGEPLTERENIFDQTSKNISTITLIDLFLMGIKFSKREQDDNFFVDNR